MNATLAEPATLKVGARLDRAAARDVLSGMDREFELRPKRLVLDLSAVESFDSAGLSTVVEGMRRAREQGGEVRLRGLSQPMLDFLSLVSLERLAGPPAKVDRPGLILRLGAFVEPKLDGLLGVLRTAKDTAVALAAGPLRGQRLRLDRTALEIDHCATGALPIILLIAFLMGLILAMQAYVQLRVFGCEIYIADMVGVAVVAEIGPLMTAIALAARSGSSNAAQLGSMVVSEEIDALKQMGIQPESFLVVPKVLACALSAVMLTALFDVVGICGGALFAWGVADIEWMAFTAQLRAALHLQDFLFALAKTVAFGTVIGTVGCSLGLRVQGGSEGVGRATTNAVVLSIFLIIIFDAVFVAVQRMALS